MIGEGIDTREPVETVYDLSQKIDRLTSELSMMQIHANTEKDSRSDYRMKELELQKTKQEIGKLKSNLEKLKQQRKEDIKEVFETGNAKVKKYGNQELKAHSVIKCKKCGNALMEIYKDGKKDVLLDGTGKVKILFADIRCENCGTEKRFYTDGKIAKKVYEL